MIDPFELSGAQEGEPLSLVIGQSSQWRRGINIDPSLFNLTYVLRPYDPASDAVDYSLLMTSVTGGGFAADVQPSDITGWTSGRYFWDLVVTRLSDGRTKIIETGDIFLFDSTADRRSHAEIMVGKIESILQNRSDDDVESYTIKSRSISKMSLKDLREWREYYLREISNKSSQKSLFSAKAPKTNSIKVRFTD